MKFLSMAQKSSEREMLFIFLPKKELMPNLINKYSIEIAYMANSPEEAKKVIKEMK